MLSRLWLKRSRRRRREPSFRFQVSGFGFRVWGEERFLHLSYRYQDLVVWQKSRELAGAVYRASQGFPASELYGLTSQVRRAAVSVSSNIAEGQGRLRVGEFQHFLGQSRGSLFELETQLAIAFDLGFLDQAEFNRLGSYTTEVRRLLNGLLNSLRSTVASERASKTVGG